ncbi:hypothetical protein BH18THE2_BH18THE2_24540 [soil metagenome]
MDLKISSKVKIGRQSGGRFELNIWSGPDRDGSVRKTSWGTLLTCTKF